MRDWHTMKTLPQEEKDVFKQILKEEIKNIEHFQEKLENKS